jgi:hypothetical protein
MPRFDAALSMPEIERLSEIFMEPMQFHGAGNRNHPRLLREQTCKGDLSGACSSRSALLTGH